MTELTTDTGMAASACPLPYLEWVNVDRWHPTASQFAEGLSTFQNEEDVQRILRYHKGSVSADGYPHHEHSDPKCFLIARLLLQQWGKRYVEVSGVNRSAGWKRTAEGRPYFVLRSSASDDEVTKVDEVLPSMDVNVSHAGGVVALATAPKGFAAGVDVMPVELVPEGPIDASSVREFFAHFKTYFTPAEWVWIGEEVPLLSLKRFFVLWTLKESLIKALGLGFGFDLQRASFVLNRRDVDSHEFFQPSGATIAVNIDGTLDNDWCFVVRESSEWNVVAAAAWCPAARVDAIGAPSLAAILQRGSVGSSSMDADIRAAMESVDFVVNCGEAILERSL